MGKQHVVGGLLASVLVSALFADDAVAEEETVGVTVAVAVNVTELEADLLSDELGKALSNRFEVTVISGEAARAKLPAEGLPETCIAETGCLGQTAAALGVSKLILLVAVRIGGDIQVDATLYDAASKTSDSRPTVRVTDKRSQWSGSFAGAADSLLPGAKVRERTGNGGTGNGGAGNGGTGNGTDPGQGGGLRTPHYVLIGGAGVLAIGLGFAVAANLECTPNFSQEMCPEDSNLPLAADLTMAAGAAILVVGAAWLLFGPDGSSPEQPAVGVVAGPGDVGLAIGGSF